MGLGATARYYHSHPQAKAVKAKYDTTYESTPERKKYRSLLSIARHKRHLTHKPGDLSHTKNHTLVLENRKRNRQRNGADGYSTLK